MEVSVQEASDQLQIQVADLQKKVESLRESLAQAAKPSLENATAEAPLASSLAPPPAPRRILWVDDNPTNNAFEVVRLKAEGIDTIEALNTEEAMQIAIAGRMPVAAVISDMGRRENGVYRAKAGLLLIKALRKASLQMPVFVYSSQKYIERTRDEVLQAGGNGATASPVELFEMVHTIIPAAA